MTQERYRVINALADEALELSEPDRSHFLATACEGDAALLAEVRQLLYAHSSESEFMEAPLLDQLARDIVTSPDGNDLVGKQFQHYEIVSWLGSGGLGEVWLARDTLLGREVALKLLSRVSASDPLQIRRFQREARTASSLNHPNIVTIYEVGTAEAYEFIAQELVRGETLRQAFERGPLPMPQVVDLGTQVAAALAAAHSTKIVHRDIKPENIMVRPDGLVKVLDFGLARFVEGTSLAGRKINLSITRPGIILGTVKYMSPEQARGLTVDARSDLFSLGAVLYEAATGSAPFDGQTTSDIMAAILAQEPEPLSKRLSGVPQEFAAVVDRCLQKDPSKRYASAQLLKADLERIRQRTTQPRLARYGAPAAAILLAVLVIALLLTYTLRPHPASGPSFASMKITRIPVQGDIENVALSERGDYIAYFLHEPAGQSLWLRHISGSLESRLLPAEQGRHTSLAFSAGGKYISWLYGESIGTASLYRMSVVEPGKPVRIRDNLNSDVSFSPDGEWYAYFRIDSVRRQSTLMIASIDGTTERAVDFREAPKYFSRSGLAWSPDSRYVACFAGQGSGYRDDAFRLIRVRLSDGHEDTVSAKHWLWAGAVSWPTSESLFVSATEQLDENNQIWEISAKDGAVQSVTNDLSNYGRISVSSDATSILTLQAQSAVELWVVPGSDSDRAVQITSGTVRSFNSLAWTPDGHILFSALAGDFRNVWIMNSDGSHLKQLTSGSGNKRELAVTPDGKYILYHSGGAIWRMDSNGNNARQLTYGSNDAHPESTPDSHSVLYGSFRDWSPGLGGTPTLWRVSIDGGHPVPVSGIAASVPKVSPDGFWIACEYFPAMDPQLSRDDVAILATTGGAATSGAPTSVYNQLPQTRSFVSWGPNGKALEWSAPQTGFDNIWRLPLQPGAKPYEFTHFRGSSIAGFGWSRDGRKLAIARANTTRDIVLIRAAGTSR